VRCDLFAPSALFHCPRVRETQSAHSHLVSAPQQQRVHQRQSAFCVKPTAAQRRFLSSYGCVYCVYSEPGRGRCDPPTLFAPSSFPDVCVYRPLGCESARVRNHLAQPLHGEALPLAAAACANRKSAPANKQTLLRHQCDADAALGRSEERHLHSAP
jgi:hypothetical protein